MKVAKTDKSKELVAVIGDAGVGIFVKNDTEDGFNDTVFIGKYGASPCSVSLEDLLKADMGRKPVYAGEEVKITF